MPGVGPVLIAPDKFRGTLSAPEVVAAARSGAESVGWRTVGMPLADGGEGLLEAFGGANRQATVTGPGGDRVRAAWRLDEDGTAVVESALASGLTVAGGVERNDPVAATSRGTGELIVQAVTAGARRVVVGLGGSATTDGGLGAVAAVLEGLDGHTPGDMGVALVAACDVQTVFTEAARVFGPQKGATPEQVVELSERLQARQADYLARFAGSLEAAGVDLAMLPGGGAAGGLGGGLVVLGATLRPGFDLVAEHVGLERAVQDAAVLVTGEGALDAESFNGKVVGGVAEVARRHGVPVLVVAGTVRSDVPAGRLDGFAVVDLSATYGRQASWTATEACIAGAVADHLRSHASRADRARRT